MTPAEQARAEVEAWFNASSDASDAGYSVVGWEDCRDLIARLTPVFERAQKCDEWAMRARKRGLYQDAGTEEVANLRERAERAEAEIALLRAAKDGRDAEYAQALDDVARLRESLDEALPYFEQLQAYDLLREARDTLAATEPKR